MDAQKDLIDADALLVKKAQKGDIDAFETLVKKYEKTVYNMSCRMLSDKDEAMDAAQDVFLKVFKSIGNFKSEAKFSTWLYRICSNVCFDILRKRKDMYNMSIDDTIELDDGEMRMDLAAQSPGIEDEIERAELKSLVSSAVEKLPDMHRTMIVLRDFKDLSYSQIAYILDIPEGTIKSRINRARKALRQLLVNKKELKDYISV